MTTTTLNQTAAASAEALIGLLPSAAAITAAPATAAPAGAVENCVVASFVGAVSADFGVVLYDGDAVSAAAGTDSPLVSAADVLRPALEAASAMLGTGVLGPASIEDAAALFADPATAVFELTAGGTRAGWYAVRVRENGTITGQGATAPADRGAIVGNLHRINNVEMALTVEIGRTRMSVRDVLDLEPGAVIELDRSAGAPADVLLNGRLIAHGEVVVVDQDYAVRITKILDVAEGLA
ncbi:flagellar motor switch protein FliN [Diaminobutyricimonas sp. LJ205]|uniref:flagellar motor switch protein FliN n=1 Tax=Diaminobutyricimonas sp. LJ205 TaxID=2683590 RepID=UPI0012F4A3DF|nr:flagellar motor switch protein FliN [Diaminobutyricimonas sp. LJ205]